MNCYEQGCTVAYQQSLLEEDYEAEESFSHANFHQAVLEDELLSSLSNGDTKQYLT